MNIFSNRPYMIDNFSKTNESTIAYPLPPLVAGHLIFQLYMQQNTRMAYTTTFKSRSNYRQTQMQA